MSTLVPDENSMEDPLCNSSFGSMVSLDYVTPDTGYEPKDMELSDTTSVSSAVYSKELWRTDKHLGVLKFWEVSLRFCFDGTLLKKTRRLNRWKSESELGGAQSSLRLHSRHADRSRGHSAVAV